MRKFNKNSLLFGFVLVFVIAGLLGNCLDQLRWKVVDLAAGIRQGNFQSVFDFKDNVEEVSNKMLSYHDFMMDANSVKDNLLGTRVVDKEETLVVKADSGMLLGNIEENFSDEEISAIVSGISERKDQSEKSGAKYIYCSVPDKNFYGGIPENVVSYNLSNNKRLLDRLSKESVAYIDFADEMKDRSVSDIFFYTDHHWKPDSGLKATEIILDKLKSNYGFEFNSDYTDINNYTVTTYKNHFLGSYGKKVGSYFTWYGLDDFDLIIPKFETKMTEAHQNEPERTGKFEDTVLFLDHMEKDPYIANAYSTYSGGDFRLQIMKNELNPTGIKILLIRNSFSCVVAPFLALQASELHIVDDREGDYPSGEIVDIAKYINQEKFDYVIEIK